MTIEGKHKIGKIDTMRRMKFRKDLGRRQGERSCKNTQGKRGKAESEEGRED